VQANKGKGIDALAIRSPPSQEKEIIRLFITSNGTQFAMYR